jgi:NTE family protein
MTVAFVLSGGGNLGSMQAGSVAALIEGGITPDLMVGTSVGAMNAAFLATRPGVPGARLLMTTWAALGRREAFRFNLATVLGGVLGMHDHLFSAQSLRSFIRRWLEVGRIEHAAIPFAVVATDARSGDAVVLDHGDIVDALAASAAIPGLFPPVCLDGRLLVDGSLSANVPVLQAQTLGADEVYVFTPATAPQARLGRGAAAAAMRAAALVTKRTAQDQLDAAVRHAARTGGRVVVVPSAQPPAPGTFDFRQCGALTEAAYRLTSAWLKDGVGTRPTRCHVSVDPQPADRDSRVRV